MMELTRRRKVFFVIGTILSLICILLCLSLARLILFPPPMPAPVPIGAIVLAVISVVYLILASIASLLIWLSLRGIEERRLGILTYVLGFIQFVLVLAPASLIGGIVAFVLLILFFPSLILMYLGYRASKILAMKYVTILIWIVVIILALSGTYRILAPPLRR